MSDFFSDVDWDKMDTFINTASSEKTPSVEEIERSMREAMEQFRAIRPDSLAGIPVITDPLIERGAVYVMHPETLRDFRKQMLAQIYGEKRERDDQRDAFTMASWAEDLLKNIPIPRDAFLFGPSVFDSINRRDTWELPQEPPFHHAGWMTAAVFGVLAAWLLFFWSSL